MNGGGLPHSDISGSTPACGSPKLIAACHVLHRRSKPRHPPTALGSLTTRELLGEKQCSCQRACSPASTFRRGGENLVTPSWCRSRSSKPIRGPERDRTADLLNANQALSQLSYRPKTLTRPNGVERCVSKNEIHKRVGGPNRNCTCDPRVISTVLC